MEINKENLKELANTIRILSAEAVQKANSGHPGLPLGAADFAAVLFAKHLRFDPTNTEWVNRDRFILSAGHGSMLLYSLLHLFGYDLSIDDLKNFRQLGSKTPGHPEFGYTVGVEATTGPLGQGFANGVGMGLSQKLLSSKYSKEVFDHNIYALVSDGDIMEGITAEAASLAGHLKLDNLIYLYDDNEICLADSTDVCFTEDVGKRFESYGWYVQKIDGHDYDAVDKAIENAKASDLPSIICCKTTKYSGKNIRFGVREHAMGSMVNGMSYTKHWLPYSATFLVFSDYMRPVMRLAALSHIQAFYIFTHDSFWVGEDGPTHQPVEHVQSLRLIPGVYVFRPADGEEVAMSYYAALKKSSSPSAFVFTRQNLPAIEKEVSAEVGVEKGAYCISGSSNNEVILLATGSELSLAVEASKKLESDGNFLLSSSMPCMGYFETRYAYNKSELFKPDSA
ncbi:UNVERIFIED_CONTAM: hypothetical protein GTU68_032600 [Idotea baltica]|nr:hypothetical protein [Idotea baltica]